MTKFECRDCGVVIEVVEEGSNNMESVVDYGSTSRGCPFCWTDYCMLPVSEDTEERSAEGDIE